MAGLLDTIAGAQQIPVGLLSPQDTDTAKNMALLALAGGMVRGDFGGGLLGAGQAYQGAQNAAVDRMDKMQQIGLRNVQLRQAQQQWEMMQPIYKALSDAYAGAPASSAPAQPASAPVPGGPLGSGTFGIDVPGQSAPPQAAPAPTRTGSFAGIPLNVAGPVLAMGGPAELAKTVSSYNTPTDFVKTMRAANIPEGSPQWNQQLIDYLNKQTNIPLQAGRAGAPMYNSKGGIVAMAPKIPDNAIPQVVNGRVVGVTPLPGAANIMQTNAYAEAAGKAQTKPITAYKGTQPVFTNELAAAQSGDALPSPQPGVSGNFRGNPSDVAMAIANIKDPQERAKAQAAFDAQLKASGGSLPADTPLTPGLAPGISESQSSLATSNAKRYTGLVDQAADSPVRVNVYDNILNLSKQGVDTGPGQQWKNAVKGYAANTPLLGSITGSWKDDVSGFQELQKFLYQNAQRSWQAAGGTGTDAQLESFTHANPNDKMFPQALQAMAQWGKAGELALQAKTNAAQTWKDQNGGNVANMDKFERTWRNNFDPVLFQLKTMDPAQAQTYVANLKATNPNAYAALMMKATALKNIGGM